jgi:regulator of sigma E protease
MITTILIFVLILGLLVFVHELGHFVTAKKSGVRVEEFGFGLPPRVIGIQKKDGKWRFVKHDYSAEQELKAETVYSLNWIPLGGFVKIKGEEGGAVGDPDSFANKPIWKRAIILSAGVIMNFILGAVLLGIGFGVGLPQALDGGTPKYATVRDQTTQIVQVIAGYPAAKAGIAVGDEILTIEGQKITSEDFLRSYIEKSEGKDLALKIKRGDKELEVKAAPVMLEETGKPGLGFAFIETGIVSYPWYLAAWKGVEMAAFYTKEIVVAFYNLIANLIVHQEVAMDLSGPVGIAVLTGRVARLGLIYLLQFAAMLSINLAIINIFPFPALDGGRLLFLIIEKIRGRAMNQKIESLIHTIGYSLLMLLIIAVTYRDISKFSYKFVELWQRIVN